jgi:hypothetical protein
MQSESSSIYKSSIGQAYILLFFYRLMTKKDPRFMGFSNLGLDKDQLGCVRQWEKCILTDLPMGLTFDQVNKLTRVEEDARFGKKFTAAENIPKNSVVGWYKGDVFKKNDPRANINYVVELPPQDIGQGRQSYWLDGSRWLHKKESNIIFMNHSCLDFNCEMHSVVLPARVYHKKDSDGLYHPRSITASYIIGITIRDILAGEDLLSNYDGGSNIVANSPNKFHFFDTELNQRKSLRCKKQTDMIRPCECRPEGCPLNYFYVQQSMCNGSNGDGLTVSDENISDNNNNNNNGDDGDIDSSSSSSDEENDKPQPLLRSLLYTQQEQAKLTHPPLKKRRNLYYNARNDSDNY